MFAHLQLEVNKLVCYQSVSLGQIPHQNGVFISTGNCIPPFAVPLSFNKELPHTTEYKAIAFYSIMLLNNTDWLMLAIRNVPADTVLLNRIGLATSTSRSGA